MIKSFNFQTNMMAYKFLFVCNMQWLQTSQPATDRLEITSWWYESQLFQIYAHLAGLMSVVVELDLLLMFLRL